MHFTQTLNSILCDFRNELQQGKTKQNQAKSSKIQVNSSVGGVMQGKKGC